ncbi:hypothetical protein NP493_626g00016 [Ridgeia piscesae]|uniref:PAT complex subunit CCDC47 n=1 Tax=Ridgeia piscesae TaxID=27915 RepID=A0AAD9KSR8_RIDPI|nr:hypothetical protein NP493_626g00016 [Ridgeia piscesae]
MTLAQSANQHGAEVEDNDFAEFEEFDEEDKPEAAAPGEQKEEPKQPKVLMSPEADINEAENAEEEEATVEDDDDEFEHLQDDDEFEGFDKERTVKGKGQEKPPDLKITKIPLHLRTNWDSFYMEMLMLLGLSVYLLNFIVGKSKNSKLAQAWLTAHRSLLENNFSVVGDDGSSTEAQSGVLMKESENIFSLWCSGRVCCEGMLVTLKLLKRQDLISHISRIFKPQTDQIIIKVTMDEGEMDSYVFCLAKKKALLRLHKEMNDLSWYCPEKKSIDKFNVPPSFQLLSEIGEATASILDSKMVAALNKYESWIEYMHFSDQFSGPRIQDDAQPTKKPETSKVLIFCFNVGRRGNCQLQDMEEIRPLMQMVLHCIDKTRRIRLTREAKQKADRARQRMEETFLKASHSQRSEEAQLRREKKRREEKDRIMNEDDPDKQRRLEERNLKKEQKKKNPKVKMMKVKSS